MAVSLGFAVALLAAALPASADTLELKNGHVLNGRYLGGTAAQVRFEVDGRVEVFRVSEVVALTFTGSSSTSDAPVADTPAPAPVAKPTARASESRSGKITVPAGTRLLVRMIDGVDSSKNHPGDRFHASMETDLVVDDTVVAFKGADVYGRLAEAKEAGHVAGSSELKLELTDIVISGQSYPLVTGDYELQGSGRGSNTAKKVGTGAAVGAIIGAIAGGGKGAAIGAGVGAGAGGVVQVMTRGQQVRVPSETLLEFRLEQPVRVTAAGSYAN
ncbi:MAG TPA: YMGG-like glycine zipper-containing protein [Candidatus Acidoferrales bacterium]|nr:YMGG-like glycine zipper-containing protein [Candidatus Acidoferrales bacterium]